MDVKDHKRGIVRALQGFAARSGSKVKICECGLEFSDKHEYYRHKNGNRCLAKEVKRPLPEQLNLFRGRR